MDAKHILTLHAEAFVAEMRGIERILDAQKYPKKSLMAKWVGLMAQATDADLSALQRDYPEKERNSVEDLMMARHCCRACPGEGITYRSPLHFFLGMAMTAFLIADAKMRSLR